MLPPLVEGGQAGIGSCGPFSSSAVGCSPFTAPSRPLPSASAFLAGIRRSLCLGGRPAVQELERPCSWLTQHPPWPSMPLPPGMNSSPTSRRAGRKVGCCRLKHHVGWAGLCWAGLALPARSPALLTSEVLGQVWTLTYLRRSETLEVWQISASHPGMCLVSTGTLKLSSFCFPSAHVPVCLLSGDLRGLVINREDPYAQGSLASQAA